MKKLALILGLMFMFVGLGFAADGPKMNQVPCPKTTIAYDCLACHVLSAGRFVLKETPSDSHLNYPVNSMRLFVDKKEVLGYFLLEGIDSDGIDKFFRYLSMHKVKKAIIEIHSPGGALFDAQRIIGIFRYWQARGIVIETWLFGAAFSAGFYIFTAGDIRLVDEYSDLMWHELKALEGYGLKITTPSDKEEEARILRHLQNVRNEYLTTRGKLSKKELDEKISKREFWMTGADAVKYGFATGLITKK